MSQGKGPMPLEEWLPLKVQELIQSQGRIEGQRDGMADNLVANAPNVWSWLAFLHQEVLALYQALQAEHNRHQRLRRQFIATIGLAEDSSEEEIASTAKEMRQIFTEMRRVRGERESKLGNET